MSKRWQCTVCGYTHEGDTPPETCPVCGSDRSKFRLLDEHADRRLPTLLATFRLHPVAAHFPGGLLPTAAFFLALHMLTGDARLEAASYWLLMVALAVVPVSFGSGLYEWQQRFGARRVQIFTRKIALALALLLLGAAAIALRFENPALLSAPGWQSWLYLGCLMGMLTCMVLLGHYGAILVSMGAAQGSAAPPIATDAVSNTWSAAIVAQAPDAILLADTSGIIRLWNRGAERIFGLPAEQAIGQSLDLIIPENLRQRHWTGWAKVMQTGASRYGTAELLRVPALRGDGSRFSAEFSLVMLKDAAGAVTGIAALLRDVTDQWEREKHLKAELDDCRQKASTNA